MLLFVYRFIYLFILFIFIVYFEKVCLTFEFGLFCQYTYANFIVNIYCIMVIRIRPLVCLHTTSSQPYLLVIIELKVLIIISLIHRFDIKIIKISA